MRLVKEIKKYPYVHQISAFLAYHNPRSTLFDLRDELRQCQQVVDALIKSYGESTILNDASVPPVKSKTPNKKKPATKLAPKKPARG